MSLKKIAILGVGLLGGSLGLALRGEKKFKLMGWNHRASSRKRAAKILPMARTIREALQGADIVLITAHSSQVVPLLSEISRFAAPDALIMDVSSVKSEIVNQASKFSWAPYHFVPCHPMAGREKSGPESAEGDLYRGKVVFISPLPKTPRELLGRAVSFWRRVGAQPVVLPPDRHDEFVALTSHLPHLLASALVDLYGDYQKKDPRVQRALGTGFRDSTRVAAGNPDMWADILGMNGGPIAHFLSRYRGRLLELEKRLGNKKNGGQWRRYFAKVKKIRKDL